MTKELEKIDQTELAKVAPTPATMIQTALDKGISPADMEKLYELYERDQANQAVKAFNRAVLAFKANPPVILKDSLVDYTTSKGRTTYRHAKLDNIMAVVDPALHEHGLMVRWKEEPRDDGSIYVTCILSHVDGHSETSTKKGPSDTSGGKNPVQALGSTSSYLQRYTLLEVLGLVAKGVDDDGGRGEPERMKGSDAEKITDEQALEIEAFIKDNELPAANVNSYLMSKGYESYADIPAARFNNFMAMLKRAVSK